MRQRISHFFVPALVLMFLGVMACKSTKEAPSQEASGVLLEIFLVNDSWGRVISNKGGIDCGRGKNSCEAKFEKGTSVKFTAEPKPGFLFRDWDGLACGREKVCTLVIDKPRRLFLKFKKPTRAKNLWIMNSDGSGAKSLTKISDVNYDVNKSVTPQWSSNGKRIIFSSGKKFKPVNKNSEHFESYPFLWIVESSGTEAKPLAKVRPAGSADWSPDDKKIIFESLYLPDEEGNPPALWVVDVEGKKTSPLSKIKIEGLNPQWSPDGKKILFRAPTNNSTNLWLANANGSGAKTLTQFGGDADVYDFQWAPNGSQIILTSTAFLDLKSADSFIELQNLWTVSSDGKGLKPITRLTKDSATSQNPQWSPDGKQIAYDSKRALDGTDGESSLLTANIWVGNPDGSGHRPITQTKAKSQNPVWSPDGENIIFDEGGNIWVINADGTGVKQLTQDEVAEDTDPQWSPDGKKVLFFSNRPIQ